MRKKRNKSILYLLLAALMLLSFAACQPAATAVKPTKTVDIDEFVRDDTFEMAPVSGDSYEYNHELNIVSDNYRNYYEIFVRSFNDSDGDGIGDLKGVTQKLDYLTDLGITGIWLMPINPSPSYHKYDVTDYLAVDPQYGTMEDFTELAAECEKRDIKLILDLVLNHSSTQHPWFTNALAALNRGDTSNKYVGYYNFNRTGGNKYYGNGSFGVPQGWYYEAYFWDQMPDLNMDSAELRAEIQSIAKFWLEKGVGGFRLDAAMHIYGESAEEKNLAFWTWFYDYCKSVRNDFYMVGEVWSTADKVSKYFASGMSVFNYPFASPNNGTFASSVLTEGKGAEFAQSLTQWQKRIRAVSPDAIDAPFLSNHDNGRSAGVYKKNIYAIKMAAALYLMAPGSPYLYYGEEIGMLGSGRDENKRAPMYWSGDEEKNCDAPPGMEEVTRFFPSAELQMKYSNLIYATYKRALRIRNENPEIARGTIEEIRINDNIACYRSTYNGSSVVILHNLSRVPLSVKLYQSELNYSGVRGYLSSTGEKFWMDGENFVLPAYSTLILK